MYGTAEELSDLPTLMNNLLSSAATFRGHPDGAATARLLEAAAQALQQQVAETKVQRGLAIASQTLASELSIKCERLQARLEPHAPAGANGAALHHPPPTPMATPSGAPLGGGGGGAQCSYTAGGYGAGAGAASPACSLPPQPLQTPAALQSQQLQQLQALQQQQLALQSQMQGQPQQPQPYPHHQQQQQGLQGQAQPHTPADGATERLGPRAFKTWTQDQPAAGGGGVAGGGALASTAPPSGGGGGGAGGNPADVDPAERAVEAMVENLKHRFRQSGVALPLEKHAGSVYRLGAKKLSLNIRSSRLMVRVGGGYCDFLEYLSKASI